MIDGHIIEGLLYMSQCVCMSVCKYVCMSVCMRVRT